MIQGTHSLSLRHSKHVCEPWDRGPPAHHCGRVLSPIVFVVLHSQANRTNSSNCLKASIRAQEKTISSMAVSCLYASENGIILNYLKPTIVKEYHFYNGTYYVSFNTRSPPFPPREGKDISKYYPEQFYSSPSWFDSRCPYAPFSLCTPPWDETIFSILKGNKWTYPLQEEKRRRHWSTRQIREGAVGKWEEYSVYKLQPALQEEWSKLEQALILLQQDILRLSPEFLHPVDIAHIRLPHCWGYMREHESRHHALIRIENSRNAFNLLLALCTYAVAATERSPSNAPANYRWVERLLRISHASEVWVNDIASSSVMAKGAARAGVYIDGRTFFCLKYITTLRPIQYSCMGPYNRGPYRQSLTGSFSVYTTAKGFSSFSVYTSTTATAADVRTAQRAPNASIAGRNSSAIYSSSDQTQRTLGPY